MPVYHRRFGLSRAPLQFFCGSMAKAPPHPCPLPPLILRAWALTGLCLLIAGLICPESSHAKPSRMGSPDLLAPDDWLLAGSRPVTQGSHKPIPEPPPPPALPGHGMADSPLPFNVLGVRNSRGNRWLRAWRFSPRAQHAGGKLSPSTG